MNAVVYQSDAGSRLRVLPLAAFRESNTEKHIINLYPQRRYQTVLGFGGAFTEASAVNYAAMSDRRKKEFLTACFDKEQGAGFNFCRSTMNSCDFSLRQYDYCEKNDPALNTFSVQRDEETVLPLLRDALKTAPELKLFFSPWSPCAWMKENGTMLRGGRLKQECYPVWAEYFARFIEDYKARGVDFFALTVQNEPNATQTWESCFYTATEQMTFVREHLLPTLKRHGLGTKVMVWDHNKEQLYDWAEEAAKEEDVWGIGFHWYSGDHFDALTLAHDLCPRLNLCATEFCCGGTGNGWNTAELYAHEMIGNFNHYAVSSTDWNLLLNTSGGSYHDRIGGCTAPLYYDEKNDRLQYNPVYYAACHFSRFVTRGAVRVGTTVWARGIEATAFENPDGSLTAVILNSTNADETANLRKGGAVSPLHLPAHSITTVCLGGK